MSDSDPTYYDSTTKGSPFFYWDELDPYVQGQKRKGVPPAPTVQPHRWERYGWIQNPDYWLSPTPPPPHHFWNPNPPTPVPVPTSPVQGFIHHWYLLINQKRPAWNDMPYQSQLVHFSQTKMYYVVRNMPKKYIPEIWQDWHVHHPIPNISIPLPMSQPCPQNMPYCHVVFSQEDWLQLYAVVLFGIFAVCLNSTLLFMVWRSFRGKTRCRERLVVTQKTQKRP